MSKVKIYQIKDIEKTVYAFRDFNKEAFNFDDYTLVAEKEMEIPAEYATMPQEFVFIEFNGEARKEFKMQSLSVSDIIEIDGARYYVQNFGFLNLEEK